MKKISVNQIISPTSRQPFTGRSLKFLQDALDEDKAGIIKAFVTSQLGSYSLSVPYVISGCVVSDSNKDVTAGEIFFGGKYYETTEVNGTTNVAQFILTKTQDATADPLKFTDGTSKNVHDIYKYVATDVASGGDFDATDLVSVYGTKVTSLITPSDFTTSSTSFIELTGATYTTPNDGLTRKWLIDAKSVFRGSSPTDTGGFLQIYDSTNTTVLDVSEAYYSEPVTLFVSTLKTHTIATIAPNTIIKLRVRSSQASGVDFNNNVFTMVEL
jgi:hypothetical protein